MAHLAFGEMKGDHVVLAGPGGAPWEASVQPDIVLLSRLDCEVTCMEIPPVAEHELPSLIRYRIRSVYPGNLENAVIDQVVQRGKSGRVAIVCIIDKEALEKYRRAAPKAILSLLSTALPGTPGFPGDGPVVHWCPRYIEVMKLENGRLVESVLVKKSRHSSDSQRIVKLLENAPPGQQPALIAPEKDIEPLQKQFAPLALPGGTVDARTEESVVLDRRRTPSLFPQRRNLPTPRPALVRSVLALAVILLAGGAFTRYLGFKERELAGLRKVVLGTQETGQQQVELNARYDSLKSRVAALIQGRPVDVFQFFVDLREELGADVVVQDIVLQNASFQLQATGPSPLSNMRRFLADSRFQDVRLLQTTPIPGGTSRQQFIITGKYAQ